jgi:hypothetical protein
MKTEFLICLMAMLLISQPALAQQTIDKNCLIQEAVDLGDIGKDRVNLVENGSLNPIEMKWFQFNVSEPVRLFIKASNPDENYYSSTDFGLVVYDENTSYVASGEGLLAKDFLPGSYYARLDARPFETANYTLIISNNFETEPNDGMMEANDLGTITKSQFFGGCIDPAGDADFIKFNLADGESGKLTVDSEDDLSLVLYSYNESKKYYQPEYTDTYSLTAFIDPGIYYLRIEGSDSYQEEYNYTMNISVSSITCDKEPNDSFAQAISLGNLNSSEALTEVGCLQSDDDEDYFKFEVRENMSVTMKTITEGDTRLYLYNSSKDELDHNDDYEGYAGKSQIERDLDAGEYYLMVDGFASGIEYGISVEASDESES